MRRSVVLPKLVSKKWISGSLISLNSMAEIFTVLSAQLFDGGAGGIHYARRLRICQSDKRRRRPKAVLCAKTNDANLFRGHYFLILKSRMQRVPGQAGAFNPHRVLAHAGKYLQTAEVVWLILLVKLAGYHAMKIAEHIFGFLPRLSLYGYSHHAGRGFRNRAAGTFKADVLDGAIFKLQVDGKLIAAKRIKAFRSVIGRLELMKIARLLVVVENNLLIKFA